MNTNNTSWVCDPLSPQDDVKGFQEYYPFELWINYSWRLQCLHNWKLCFWIAGVYMMFVILGQRIMQNRTAFRLQRPLLLWNMFISISNLFPCIRVGQEILAHMQQEGFLSTLCDLGPIEHQALLGTYLIVFALSRAVELGDTVFLVLRRKPVPFTHCFHHIVILLATWSNTGYPSVVGGYFMSLNFGMHFLAYGYLTLKTLHVRLPPVMAPLLVALEVTQSMFGLGITLYAQSIKRTGVPCCLFDETANLVYGLYISIVIVFSKLMFDTLRNWKASHKEKEV